MKKILFVASEAVPFIKTGGLADVVGALPKCFDKNYFDVRVIIPKYMCMKEEYKNQLQYITHFYMDIAGQNQYVGVLKESSFTSLIMNTISQVISHMEISALILRNLPFSPKQLFPSCRPLISGLT